MGHFPAAPASQSGLRIACTFDACPATSQASNKFTIHDFSVAQYHNGAARSITNTASIASGATTFTAANCAGLTAYVNRPISALTGTALVTGVPARLFVKSISGACLVTLNKAVTAIIPASTVWKIDNTIGRSVADGVTNATTTITSATANFTAADAGLSVSGTDIPNNTTIATFVNATTVTLNNAATASNTGQVLTFGGSLLNTTTRQANDATITSATVINSPAAKWKTDDVGLKVAGGGIPANTFIVSVSGANATTTGGLTITAVPFTVIIGEPSATAPADGATAVNENILLDVDPGFVPEAGPCLDDRAEAVSIVGQWQNPGTFDTGVFSTQPAGTKAIGQIKFVTAFVSFAAFVIERGALTAGDPIGAVHYDIVVPYAPILFALCSSATSPGFGYSISVHSQTSGVAAIPSGVGKPGSEQLRSLLPQSTGAYASTVYLSNDDPTVNGGVFTPASEFNRLCIYPDPVLTTTVNFTCGDG